MLTIVFWVSLALAWFLYLCKPFRHARYVAWLVLAFSLCLYGVMWL